MLGDILFHDNLSPSLTLRLHWQQLQRHHVRAGTVPGDSGRASRSDYPGRLEGRGGNLRSRRRGTVAVGAAWNNVA